MTRILICVAISVAITGCASVEPVQPVTVKGDSFCSIGRKITWSKRDTPPTIDQVRRHNAKYDRVCR